MKPSVSGSLFQLAVLAAAPIVGGAELLLFVGLFLAGNAQLHAGQGTAAGFGNGFAAFGAFTGAFTGGQMSPGGGQRIV